MDFSSLSAVQIKSSAASVNDFSLQKSLQRCFSHSFPHDSSPVSVLKCFILWVNENNITAGSRKRKNHFTVAAVHVKRFSFKFTAHTRGTMCKCALLTRTSALLSDADKGCPRPPDNFTRKTF